MSLKELIVGDFDNSLLFKSIVELGSLTNAAKHWNINASAASKRLNRLEASLGTQLIKRTTRKLTLTEAGQYFYEKIARLSNDWQAATEETISLGRQPKGRLRLAVPQPVASRFLMPVLARFQQQYPAVSLEIVHKQMSELPSLNADVSICRELDRYDSSTMVVRPFFEYRNYLFASPGYLADRPEIKTLHDIQQHQCLVYNDENTVSQWHFETETLVLDNTTATNNAEIMICAASQGMGLVFVPEVIVQQELKRKDLVRVLPTISSGQFKTCAYFLKADFVPQKVRLFLDFLITELA
ncbi:MAG: LysR family transcriptional regulator [Arenicella sp.]